jgi:tRNA nucleotidyltransferase (CCA-adding enzyme)
VRDAILNRMNGAGTYAPKDIDIEVFGIKDPQLLKHELSKRGIVNEQGVSFGVLSMQMDGIDYDIALPRRDSKAGRGHRGFDVDFTSDIEEVEAFGRRDYTINAMGWDPTTQQLIDPYGGTQDLYDGMLRHTTSAFSDDPLRVLRGVQFAARFGFDMAPETAEESARIKGEFSTIAAERVWGEFDKILTKGTHISKAIRVLQDTGWMEHFPELGRMEDVPQDPKWHPEGNVLEHLGQSADRAALNTKSWNVNDLKVAQDKRIVVFSALVHDLGKFGEGTQIHHDDNGNVDKITSYGHPTLADDAISSFGKRIGAPRSVTDPAKKLTQEHMVVHGAHGEKPSGHAVRKLVRRLGDGKDGASLYNLAQVIDADQGGRGEASITSKGAGWAWMEKARELDNVTPPKVLVRGNMLADLGVPRNEMMGEIVKASLVAQDNEEFTDFEGAREWAKKYVAGLSLPTVRIDPRA